MINTYSDTECSICFDEINTNYSVACSYCINKFCTKCIIEYYNFNIIMFINQETTKDYLAHLIMELKFSNYFYFHFSIHLSWDQSLFATGCLKGHVLIKSFNIF